MKATGDGELRLSYGVKVENGPHNTNSGCFLPDAGHVRDQDFWRPFLEISSLKDLAHFTLKVHIPVEYRVATGFVQEEWIEGAIRTIRAKSTNHASAPPSFTTAGGIREA